MSEATPAPPDPEAPSRPVVVPASRSSGRRLLAIVALLAGVAMLSASSAYAVAARADARQSWASSRSWAGRSAQQATEIEARDRTIAELDRRTAQLEQAVADAGALLDARTAEAEALRRQLDEVTARLAVTEARLAELAGVQARATDQLLAGG